MTDALQDRSELVLCRQALYGSLALALQRPTPDTVQTLLSQNNRNGMTFAALRLVGALSRQQIQGLEESDGFDLRHKLDGWMASFYNLTFEQLLAEHGDLFGHTVRGRVCPYEAEYGQEGLFQQPQQLASLSGFYQTFGLQVKAKERERPDHIACELEFMEFLSRKEAFAAQGALQEMELRTRSAARVFLNEHLGRFGRAFSKNLERVAREGFWGRLGPTLFDFLTLDCYLHGLRAGPPEMDLCSTEEDKVPMACADDLVSLQV